MTSGRGLQVVALTRDGARLAGRVAETFPGAKAWAPARFAAGVGNVRGFREPVGALLARLWPEAGGFFLIMAAGIAVRSVAPLLADKETDPAVVVLDQACKFAIPVLSGHLGGANDLAREAERLLGATAVITTATDVVGAPAVEVWARGKGLRWEDRRGVVAVNGAWASGEPVGAYSDPLYSSLLEDLRPSLALATEDVAEAAVFGGVFLALSHRLVSDLRADLWLRPPCLCLGVGCRRSADPSAVEQGVRGALSDAGLAALAAAEVVSVDEKAGEPALLRLAEALGVPFRTFPSGELAQIPVPTPSNRVAEAVGTPSVSEAAAIKAAEGGPLLLKKVTGRTWTLAVALKEPMREGEG